MKNLEKLFLESLKLAIRGEKYSGDIVLDDRDWQVFFALASAHHVLPLVFDALREVPQLKEKEFTQEIKQNIRRQVFMHIQKTGEFLRLYKLLLEKGIIPLVVKGAVCRSLYPNPELRISSDEDILIPEKDTLPCHDIFTAIGLTTPETDLEKAHELPYRKKGSSLYIELHRSLFPRESDAYGDFNSYFTKVFDNICEVDVQGNKILSLSPSEHFFYLICHAFKHFLHSGFGLRQVCDILLFAEKYREEIDWTKVFENSKAIRAEYFTAAMFRMGVRHLGFSPDALPKEFLSLECNEEAMLGDLLDAGVFGSSTMSRRHSSNITLEAVVSGKQGKKGRNSLILALFPPAKSLEGRYPYLKEKKYLLPLAWVQRIASYGRESAGQKNNSAAEALKIGAERRELLKKYKIID